MQLWSDLGINEDAVKPSGTEKSFKCLLQIRDTAGRHVRRCEDNRARDPPFCRPLGLSGRSNRLAKSARG